MANAKSEIFGYHICDMVKLAIEESATSQYEALDQVFQKYYQDDVLNTAEWLAIGQAYRDKASSTKKIEDSSKAWHAYQIALRLLESTPKSENTEILERIIYGELGYILKKAGDYLRVKKDEERAQHYYELAINCLFKAILGNNDVPSYIGASINLVYTYIAKGNFDMATQLFEAMKQEPMITAIKGLGFSEHIGDIEILLKTRGIIGDGKGYTM